MSDDGTSRVRHVFLDGVPDHAGVGSDVAVRFLGEDRIVYKATGSREWLLIAVELAVAVIALGVWAAAVYARTHGRYLPLMLRPWTKPRVLRDERHPDKTGHRGRRGKKKRRG